MSGNSGKQGCLSCPDGLTEAAAVDTLRSGLVDLLTSGQADLCINLSGVTAMSAGALQVLISAANTLRSLEKPLVLKGIGPEMRTFLQRLNLLDQFSISNDPEGEGI